MAKQQRKYPSLTITLVTGDQECLAEFACHFGGNVRPVKWGNKPVKRQLYLWQRHGKEAQKVLSELLPFLKSKREVAALALLPDFETWGNGKKMPEEELELRCRVKSQISQINNRVTVQATPSIN